MSHTAPGPASTPSQIDGGPTFRPVPEIAAALDVPVTRVHQLIRDQTLVAARRGGTVQVPAEFVQDGAVVKGLPGTITLLSDAGYHDDEIIGWLFAADPGGGPTAIAALRQGRHREVHRRAQVAGF